MNTDWLVSLFTSLATQIPMFLVYIAGAAIGIARWKRHPKVSRLVVSASLFLLVLQFGVSVVYSLSSLWAGDGGIPYEYLRYVYMVLGASDAFAGAAGHGVLIAAIFVDRAAVNPDA